MKRARIDAAELHDQDNPALAQHFGEAVDLAEISIVGMGGGADTLANDGFAQMDRYTRTIGSTLTPCILGGLQAAP